MKIPALSFLGLLVVGLILQFGRDYGLDGFVQIQIIYILINVILGMSLNLVNGLTGQFSLGHAGFMAVGAYTSAFLSMQVPALPAPLAYLTFPLFTICGGLLAAFAGWLVGLPSLRLRGDYLAIVTLGFGEIIRVSILNSDPLGGARGLFGIPALPEWDLGFFTVSSFLASYTLAIFWTLTCFFVIWRLVRSAHGRAFLSVREDEIAAEAMGVNTTQAKIRAFVISSFFAGVAGAIFAHFVGSLTPNSFAFNRSVDAVIIVVLGGMGSLTGSILAAVFVTIFPELLRPLQEILGVDLRMVIYALSLVLLMILRPKGLFGNQELPDLWRKYVRKTS